MDFSVGAYFAVPNDFLPASNIRLAKLRPWSTDQGFQDCYFLSVFLKVRGGIFTIRTTVLDCMLKSPKSQRNSCDAMSPEQQTVGSTAPICCKGQFANDSERSICAPHRRMVGCSLEVILACFLILLCPLFQRFWNFVSFIVMGRGYCNSNFLSHAVSSPVLDTLA